MKQEKKSKKGKTEEPEKKDEVKIDLTGLQDRIVALPVDAGNYSDLGVGEEGKVFYIIRPAGFGGDSKLHMYDIKEKKDKEVMNLEGPLESPIPDQSPSPGKA